MADIGRLLRRAAWPLTLALHWGCDDPTQTTANKSPAESVSALPAALAPPAPARVPQPPPDQTARLRERLERYASWLEDPDLPDCTQFGVLLRVAWPAQKSRTVWLADLLRAEPDLGKMLRENRVRGHQAVYGQRNYGRSYQTTDISREALIIECEDRVLCRAFAGFYGRIDPYAKPKAFCGDLPGRSGGNMPLDLERLVAGPRSFPHGVCARFRACLAALDRPAESCDGFERPAAQCAEEVSCEAVLACFAKQTRNPKRPLWSDEPQPRNDFSRPRGSLGF